MENDEGGPNINQNAQAVRERQTGYADMPTVLKSHVKIQRPSLRRFPKNGRERWNTGDTLLAIPSDPLPGPGPLWPWKLWPQCGGQKLGPSCNKLACRRIRSAPGHAVLFPIPR